MKKLILLGIVLFIAPSCDYFKKESPGHTKGSIEDDTTTKFAYNDEESKSFDTTTEDDTQDSNHNTEGNTEGDTEQDE